MVATEGPCQIPRSLLIIINNVHVINNYQQALAARTPNRAQLAMIIHPGLSFNASCTPLGLTISFDIGVVLVLCTKGREMILLDTNA